MRISEVLGLLRSQVMAVPQGFICLLGRTKRGVDQRVPIRDPLAVEWLHRFLDSHQGSEQTLFPCSYGKCNYWIKRLSTLFGLPTAFTTHSLRRGGATALLMKGWRVDDICVLGRWASLSSARLYLERGRNYLLAFAAGHVTPQMMRIVRIADVGASVWQIVERSGKSSVAKPERAMELIV